MRKDRRLPFRRLGVEFCAHSAASCDSFDSSESNPPIFTRPETRQEWLRVALVAAHLFLVIASYLVLKSVRDALYLNSFGAVKLPYVMIGIAVLIGLFVDVYIRAARRIPSFALVSGTLACIVPQLFVFWIIARQDRAWLYPLIYVWVGGFGVLAPVQVWTLAAEVFTTREAKRYFGFIGAAGILGASFGGTLTGSFASRWGAVHFLLVAAALIGASFVVVLLLSRLPGKRSRQKNASSDSKSSSKMRPANLSASLRRISRSAHLRIMTALIFVSALSTTIIDYVFKARVSEVIGDRDALAAYFGGVYGAMALLGFAVQILLVRWVFQRFGLGPAIVALPWALLVGSGFFLLSGTLLAATLLKGSDGVLKHSIDRSSKELAYLPISNEVKLQVKSVIDMVLDRLGDGIGGTLLLIAATWWGLSPNRIAGLNMVLIALWVFLALRVRRSYVAELEYSIAGLGSASALDAPSLESLEGRRALCEALGSSDSARVTLALELAALAPSKDFEPALYQIARHGDPKQRVKVLLALMEPGERGVPYGFQTDLQRSDQELLVQAIDLVLAKDREEIDKRAALLLEGGTAIEKGALLALLTRRLGTEMAPLAERLISSMMRKDAPSESRRAAATALGLLPRELGQSHRIIEALQDPDLQVQTAAASSAGRIRDARFIAPLISLLGRHRSEGIARRSLTAYGDMALPMLHQALHAEEVDDRVRRKIPKVLFAIRSSRAIALLCESLKHPDPATKAAAASALWRLRRRDPRTVWISTSALDETLRKVCKRRSRLESLGSLLYRQTREASVRFLAHALKDRCESLRSEALCLLFLRLEQDIAKRVEAGLRSADIRVRDNALELLESSLPSDMKRVVIPVIDGDIDSGFGKQHDDISRDSTLKVESTLGILARDDDPWIAGFARLCIDYLEIAISCKQQAERSKQGAVPNAEHSDEETGRDSELPILEGREKMDTQMLLDRAVALGSLDAFDSVPAEQLTHIAACAREQRIDVDEHLFEQGSFSGHLLILLEGRARLERDGQVIGEIDAGQAIGTWSTFEGMERPATAIAVLPCRVLIIEREDLFDILAEHPDMARSLIHDLLARLRGVLGQDDESRHRRQPWNTELTQVRESIFKTLL